MTHKKGSWSYKERLLVLELFGEPVPPEYVLAVGDDEDLVDPFLARVFEAGLHEPAGDALLLPPGVHRERAYLRELFIIYFEGAAGNDGGRIFRDPEVMDGLLDLRLGPLQYLAPLRG